MKRRSIRRYYEEFGGTLAMSVVLGRMLPIILTILTLGGVGFALSHSASDTNVHLAGTPAVLSLITRITRDQGPEYEQTINFTANTVQSTPTPLRTDRKIKFIQIQFRGRFTNGGTGPTLRTAPALLNTQIFGIIQQVTLRGQHLRYGAQQPITMRGETIAEWVSLMSPNYVPNFSVSANGAAPVRGGALTATLAQTNDIDFTLPIPTFPLGIGSADIPFYCLHGPDWPGNLYLDIACGDGTCLATANAPTGPTAYGSGAGNAILNILTERPLLSKDLMATIRPAVTFRTTFTQQPTAAVVSGGGSGAKISDLTVGKDTTRLFLKTGTQSAGGAAGTVCFGSLLDSIVTNTFFSLDNRPLRFQGALRDNTLQDYMARCYGRTIPIGYKMIDFVASPDAGAQPDNPKAAFQSSKLTAARKFELDGDVTAAANQIAEVIQEMMLGRPALLNS